MAEMFFDDDADIKHLDGMTICILGYGNQGRSQALNLRDSGLNVIIGSQRDRSHEQATTDGFEVLSPAEAAAKAQIIFLLLPDEVMPQLYRDQIAPGLEAGNMLVFASGYNIAFSFIEARADVDVVMIAPRMIGHGVRDTYLSGEGFPSLIAVEQDGSGNALARTLALAKGLGSTKMGAIMSSFMEETIVDLFAEQVGGLYAIRRYCEVLVEAGCSPEAAMLEFYASGEIINTARAYRDVGLWEQMEFHSTTSQYGQEVTARLSREDEQAEKQRLHRVIDHIRDGEFAREWMLEQQAGFPVFKRIRKENMNHPIRHAERKLYKILGRIRDDKATNETEEGSG
jgi:ketol-acid reductoisomerase